MKVEDIAKLEKAKEVLENICTYKSAIEDLEQYMQGVESIEGGTSFTEGKDKVRVRLSKELTIKVLHEVLEEYKSTVARLEKEFEELLLRQTNL